MAKGSNETLYKKWENDTFSGTVTLPKNEEKKKPDKKTIELYKVIDKALNHILKMSVRNINEDGG